MSIKNCLPLACIVVTAIFTFNNGGAPPAPTPVPPSPPPVVVVHGPVLHVPPGCVGGSAVVSVSGSSIKYIEYQGHKRSSFFGIRLKRGEHRSIKVVVLTSNGHRYVLRGKVCRRNTR